MEINVKREDLAKVKLMICTPAYGGLVNASYTKSMIDLTIKCIQHGIQLNFHFLSNESLITRARNYSADHFMRSECTHLLFVDSDIGFEAESVIQLVAITLMDPKYKIIGGVYPKKSVSWEKVKYAVDKGLADENPNVLENFIGDFVFNLKDSGPLSLVDPVEVSELGTGFMLITRDVFEAMNKAYPELLYRPDHARTDEFNGQREIMAYFDCVIQRGYSLGDLKNLVKKMIASPSDNNLTIEAQMLLSKEETASKRYLSEDYFFCMQAQRIGISTWACPWQNLSHTGSYTFKGSLAEMLQIGANPTIDDVTANKFKTKE